MRLIIGGKSQGKLNYGLSSSGYTMDDVAFCQTDEIDKIFNKKIIYALHELVLRLLQDGIEPVEYIKERLNNQLIICNEIGCGIVPMEKFERDYRDAVGDICCEIAQNAEIVERCCCGIPIRIKG